MTLPQIIGGYEQTQFLDNQNLENFQCAICTLIRKETVSLPCNHYFCRECIGRWVITNHTTCPSCRLEFGGHKNMKTIQPDPSLSLEVKCDNKGCSWIGKLGNRNN